jgi:ABC-type amino acid transport substrate-binding protein
MKIGVVPGTTGEQYAHLRAREAKLPPQVFVQYPSESQLLPALLSGKIDAIARGEIGNEYQASMNKELVTIAKKDFHEGFAFAVDKSNKRLIVKLNEAINIITDKCKLTYAQWQKNHNVFMEQVSKK